MTNWETFDGGPEPASFVATTVNVYVAPFVSPVTVIGLPAPEAVSPPGDDVTVYEVIGAPPLSPGAMKLTVACPFPGVAVVIVGAPGIVRGVTAFDASDGDPVPAAFVAVTVNV
jgi:hypothetical protein